MPQLIRVDEVLDERFEWCHTSRRCSIFRTDQVGEPMEAFDILASRPPS